MPRVAGSGEPQRAAETHDGHRDANLELRATLMARLVAVSDMLRASPSAESAATAAGRALLMLTGAPRGAVFLRSQNGAITCPWVFNLSDEYVGRLQTPPDANPWAHLSHHPELACMGLPLRGRARAAAPTIIEDIRALPAGNDTRRAAEREGIRALCSWPLSRGGRVFAAVTYYFSVPHTCAAPEREVVLAFALQATAMLEQALATEARGEGAAEAEPGADEIAAAEAAEAGARLELEASRLAALQRALDADGARLSAERTDLAVERERLDAARREVETERERLAETRRGLDAESQRFAAARAELEADRKRVADQRREAEAEHAQLETFRRAVDSERLQITGLREELDAARGQLAGTRAELEAERAGVAKSRADLEAERERIAAARRALDADRAALTEAERARAVQAANASAEPAEPDASKSARAAAELEEEKSRLIEAHRELGAAEADLSGARTALEAETARLAEVRRELEADRARLSDVQRALEADRLRFTELHAANGTLAAECARLSSAVATLTELVHAVPAPVSAPPPPVKGSPPRKTPPADSGPATTLSKPAAAAPAAMTSKPAPRPSDAAYASAIRSVYGRQKAPGKYSERLAGWAEAAARALGCKDDQILELRQAALLMGVDEPDGSSRSRGVKAMLDHRAERWDGAGTPGHLKEGAIPLGARILAVAAAYADMVAGGPGTPMLYYLDAKAQLMRNAGTAFDPEVVQAFCRVVDRG